MVCYNHIPTLKVPTIILVCQLIQNGKYAFSIPLKDAYLYIPIVKHFYDLFHKICNIGGKIYLLGWPQPLGFSLPLLNLSCSFAYEKISVLLSTSGKTHFAG